MLEKFILASLITFSLNIICLNGKTPIRQSQINPDQMQPSVTLSAIATPNTNTTY